VPIAVIGLEHGHAMGLFNTLRHTHNVEVVGIVEKDATLRAQYEKRFSLDTGLFYDTSDAMLAARGPKAVLVYTSPEKHRAVIEWAAKHGLDAMMEKPFATTLADAIAMRDAGRKYHTRVLVNYETSWYASNAQVLKDVTEGKLGHIYKVVVHDGHQGPKEIGVGPEFLAFLGDPTRGGAGAMFDFGCYGADLMTVMRHGELPISVTAVAQTNKPGTYPHVDDDATIILRYKDAQAVLMPSWDWSFARKDMEVYGDKGIEVALDPDHMSTRFDAHQSATTDAAPKLPLAYTNSLEYLAAIERGEIKGDDDLTSVDINLATMQILDAAKRSAQTGRTVTVVPVSK
jgi:predicted dehydrogenase